MSKTYLFVSYTNFKSGKLTGAHKRFLELLQSAARDSRVIYVGHEAPQLEGNENVTFYSIREKRMKFLPQHLDGAWGVYRKLRELRGKISVDRAVSFSPVLTISCYLAGVRNIVSLFREDLIGYLRSLQASKGKLLYYGVQERLAVCFSDKIIVQCENDRANLISRNEKYCKGLKDKVHIQINNANASWMRTESRVSDAENEVPHILFIGNFGDRRKGHFLLLPAVVRLLDEGLQLELMVAGDGAEKAQWEQSCARYPQIHFLGQVSDMPKYLRQADFMMVPSLIDSCPNTVLEGLNAGIAVYGARAGGVPDLLEKDEYLFEPNEESIYAFLKDVLTQKRYRADREAQKARKDALTFDWGEKIRTIIDK